MNKLSKLTALLLAIVLALGVPLGAMAESAEIETKTEYYEVADKILQAMIMNYQTYGEYKSMAEIIADEDFAAFLEGLPEDKLKKLANYVNDMFWAACIPYTNVGPFMPAVDVTNQLETASTFSLISRATTDEETVKGLYLDKTATGPDANGQYTITLEAYVTGQVTTSTVDTFTPVDVVLVLDTSGSMAYDVSSDDTRVDYEESRRFALQQGVNTFIDQVAKQSENANHRISIVEYDRANYSVLADWSFVDTQDRVDELKGAVDTLDASGGTRPGRGLNLAYDQLTDNYKAPQGSTERKKIVVLFTDGIPSANYFQADFAAEAIETAYLLKANPAVVTEGVGATLYSIAIFPGADPATPVSTWTSIQDNNTDDIDICNAFLHAVSSNYPGARASYYGRAYNNSYGNWAPAHGLNITPGTGGNNGYYLTADSVESMKEIFTKISNNIQTGSTSSTLTETTVVKDVMSPYFELPPGFSADSVTVQTADYKGTKDADGNLEWDDPAPFDTGADGISFGTDPDTGLDYVNVKNFGFNDNYVADVDHVDPFITNDEVGDSNVFYGRKLIISFKVEPTDGFLGGNGVVTNDVSSGVYQPGADGTLTPVEKFPVPDVDVALWKIQVIGKHQHIFLSNEADVNALLQSFSLQYTKEGSPDETYTVNGIRNDYATLKFTLATRENYQMIYTIEPGATVGTWTYVDGNNGDPIENFDVTPFLTNDAEYRISYDIIPIPKTDGTTGVAATTGFLDVGVHVYKPTFTFRDTTEKYLSDETAENYYKLNNYVSESWSHKYYNEITVTINVAYDENGTPSYSYVATNASETKIAEDLDWDMATETIDFSGYASTAGIDYHVKMSGEKPTVAFTYSPLEETWIQGGKVMAVECVPVDVTKVTLTSTNTHDKVILDTSGAVTGTDTYTTTSVYTEGSAVVTTDASNNATVTITKDGTTTPAKDVSGAHVNTQRIKEACEPCNTTVETVSTDVNTDTTDEFVIHITDVSGDLRIGKRVEPDNAPADAVFTFTLTLTDTAGKALTGEYVAIPETMTTATDEDGNEITSFVQGDPQTIKLDTNGSCTFTLQDGEHLLIKDLPAQTKYTVTETDAQGYTTFVAVDYDANRTPAKTAEGTVVSGDVTTVRFINVVQGTLLVIKQVEGVDVPDDEFRFTIELEHDDLPEEYSYEYNKYPTVLEEGQTLTPTETGYITPDKNTFTLKKDECIQILGLLAGTTYTVTETANDAYVTRVVNGPLSTASSDYSATGTIPAAATERATFFNTYQYAPLTIEKIVTGNAASADDRFLFTVTGTGITDKMQVILKAGETVTINDLPLGTYKVTEETAWSWRYELDSVTCGDVATTNGAEHQLDPSGLSYVFTNSVDNQQWLDGNAHADNNFTGSTTTEGDGN